MDNIQLLLANEDLFRSFLTSLILGIIVYEYFKDVTINITNLFHYTFDNGLYCSVVMRISLHTIY